MSNVLRLLYRQWSLSRYVGNVERIGCVKNASRLLTRNPWPKGKIRILRKRWDERTMIDIRKTMIDGRMEWNGSLQHSWCWILHLCCHRLRNVNDCAQNSWNKMVAHCTVWNAALAGHKLEILRSECLQSTDNKIRWWLRHYGQGSSSNEPSSFWGQHNRHTSDLCRYCYLDTEPTHLWSNIVVMYIDTQLYSSNYYTRDRVLRNTVGSQHDYLSLYLISWGFSIDNAGN
jgi:hypothetical protein